MSVTFWMGVSFCCYLLYVLGTLFLLCLIYRIRQLRAFIQAYKQAFPPAHYTSASTVFADKEKVGAWIEVYKDLTRGEMITFVLEQRWFVVTCYPLAWMLWLIKKPDEK